MSTCCGTQGQQGTSKKLLLYIYGSQSVVHSINSTWELVRNAGSQARPRLIDRKLWGWSPAICVLTRLLSDLNVC